MAGGIHIKKAGGTAAFRNSRIIRQLPDRGLRPYRLLTIASHAAHGLDELPLPTLPPPQRENQYIVSPNCPSRSGSAICTVRFPKFGEYPTPSRLRTINAASSGLQ